MWKLLVILVVIKEMSFLSIFKESFHKLAQKMDKKYYTKTILFILKHKYKSFTTINKSSRSEKMKEYYQKVEKTKKTTTKRICRNSL